MSHHDQGTPEPTTVVILGAAGRDFHNFNTVFRDDPRYRVVAFTATQIPDIDGRRYPASLAGGLYPDGIPIVDESGLDALIADEGIDVAVFSYSDIAHVDVMHLASRCLAAGADYWMLGGRQTMIRSTKPVVAVCAVRTGVGKSQTTRYVAQQLIDMGLKVVAIRHPMPYGDLEKQVCQRYAAYEDLDRYECTIEEREEYEPHIDSGVVIYAGVDYEVILREAEKEADVILWDGGNNDLPFYAADLFITLVDPLRPYFSARGETKLDLANYYLSVGPGIVRALRERPCMLHRFPDGVDGDKVHQKRIPRGAPPWLETVRLHFPRWGLHADELCVTRLADVIWAVQMSTVEFHPWNSRRADTETPDEWRIDLDPMPQAPYAAVRRTWANPCSGAIRT